MDLIAGVFTYVWNGLDELQVPIIDITMKEFLLSLVIINICFGLLNFFLGKHSDTTDKGG